MTAAALNLDFAGAIERNPLKAIDRRFLALLAASFAAHLTAATLVALHPTPVSWEEPAEIRVTRSPLMRNPFAKPAEPPTSATAPASTSTPSGAAAQKHPAPREAVNPVNVGLLALIGHQGGLGGIDDVLSEGTQELSRALAGATSVQVATLETAQRKASAVGAQSSIGVIGTEGAKTVELKEATLAQVKAETRIDTSDLPQTAGLEGLRDFLHQRRRALQYCYERQLKQQPSLAGRLTVRFMLNGPGRPSEVEVDDESLGNAAVALCVKTVVSGWSVPFAASGAVEFPLVFAAAQ